MAGDSITPDGTPALPSIPSVKQIAIRLSEELVTEIDEARGDVPRERWIRRSIVERLEAERTEICDNVDTDSSRSQAFRKATQRY